MWQLVKFRSLATYQRLWSMSWSQQFETCQKRKNTQESQPQRLLKKSRRLFWNMTRKIRRKTKNIRNTDHTWLTDVTVATALRCLGRKWKRSAQLACSVNRSCQSHTYLLTNIHSLKVQALTTVNQIHVMSCHSVSHSHFQRHLFNFTTFAGWLTSWCAINRLCVLEKTKVLDSTRLQSFTCPLQPLNLSASWDLCSMSMLSDLSAVWKFCKHIEVTIEIS